jgi:ABC-2 type transport system permease protein
MSNSPIADLSYRHYDGPLSGVGKRWWSIARMTMQVATKRRGFWGWSLFSAWWFFILLAVFWFMDNVLGGLATQSAGANVFLKQIVWKDQFVHGYSFSQMILMVITLMIGVGTIANDNRANALLVYLSKPCSRLDYVLGKWLGIFILISLVSFVPMMIFWLYGFMSFQQYGFWTSAPWLFLKLALLAMCSGAIHASLALAVSSMFNQGRLAGATYAGIYFMLNIFTKIMQGVSYFGPGSTPGSLSRQLFYGSVDGLQIGLSKLIIGTNGSDLFPGMSQNSGRRRADTVDPAVFIINAPNAAWIVPVFVLLVVGGFAVAYSRIKAVEVVG